MTIELHRAIPIFRIYSLEKAREFYVDFLGFKVD
jgi:catechol 2,3-dioxygenase-like lactoylglutathione lyase family enzyme